MPWKPIAFSLLVLSFHGAVSARDVELLQFDGVAARDFVIHAGPSPVPDNVGPVRLVTDLSTALSADFAQIGAPAIANSFAPTSVIKVPEWMRRGIARPRLAPIVTFSPRLSAGCGDARYRPRIDLVMSIERRRARLFPLIAAIACEHQLPVGLFVALIWQESRYQVDARSPRGAMGLTQLMPSTADYAGVSDPWDPVENLRGGARYLRMQIDEFGRIDLALAAYNAGPGRVRPHRRIPRIRETIDYVQKITAAWANAEQRSEERIPTALPPVGRNSFHGAVIADYTSTSVANPR